MKHHDRSIILALCLHLVTLFSGMAWSAEPSRSISTEIQSAAASMMAAQQPGPAEIALLDQAVLKLPAGYVFIPNPAASEYMRAIGNNVDERFLGLVFPAQEPGNWMLTIVYEKSGYIKDDEAKTWNVEELLESYRKGTEANNQNRVERGLPALEVTGWVEKPDYDANTHQLVWSMSVRDKGDAGGSQGVNYNTYALGREGYVSMNLITELSAIKNLKPRAWELLAALQFNSGKTYGDFNADTDHMAEYGLAALVGGLAAKKLGLLAVAAAFFAKFAKLIIAGLLVFGAALSKFFGRKKPE